MTSEKLSKDNSEGYNTRSRSLSVLFLLSQPRDNRRLVCHHESLLNVLVTIMKEDAGEARLQACSIIATLAKTDENRDVLAGVNNLVTTLSLIVRGICNKEGVICNLFEPNNAKTRTSSEEEQKDNDDKFEEILLPARFNACAALLHLSKQCRLSVSHSSYSSKCLDQYHRFFSKSQLCCCFYISQLFARILRFLRVFLQFALKLRMLFIRDVSKFCVI